MLIIKWQLLTYTLIAYKERHLRIVTSVFLMFLILFFLLAKQCCMQKSNSHLFSSPNLLQIIWTSAEFNLYFTCNVLFYTQMSELS